METVAQYIKRKRDALDMSIDELAFISGFPKKMILSWESAEADPSRNNMLALDVAFCAAKIVRDCRLNFEELKNGES